MDAPHSFMQTPTVAEPASTATGHQISSQWPSPEQQRALATLSNLDDSAIFSNLQCLRLIAAQLTNQQVSALACLRLVPDENVKNWLDYSRRSSSSVHSERSSLFSNSSDPRFSTGSRSTCATSLSFPSTSQPATTVESIGPGNSVQDSTLQVEVNERLDLNKPQPPLPQGQDKQAAIKEARSLNPESRHKRWCTTREHKPSFKTYDGFAKHERTHDKCYVFLPRGPNEETAWGRECALCAAPNPSKEHLQEHKILKYDGMLGKPVIQSRRKNFEELLRKHKTSDERIKVLVNKWCSAVEKKAYSCGFCISIFETLPERTRHIDSQHYSKGKHIDDWNDTFVIKGLLLQKEVHRECLQLFPVDPALTEARVSWPPSVIHYLQFRLELAAEPAADLAADIFHLASERGMPSPGQSNAIFSSYPMSQMIGHSRTPPVTSVLTNNGKHVQTNIFRQSAENDSRVDGTQNQYQSYSTISNSSKASLTTDAPPPFDLQSSKTNSDFPIRSTSLTPTILTPFTSEFTDLAYAGSKNVYQPAQALLGSRTPYDDLLSYGSDLLGMESANLTEHAEFITMGKSYTSCDSLSFDASTSDGGPNAASQLDPLSGNHIQAFSTLSEPVQVPKRKLSEKSAAEANFRAQTEAPNSPCSSSVRYRTVDWTVNS